MSNSNLSSEETPVCVLSIQGCGEIPNFKNHKIMIRRGTPQAMLITSPRVQKFMKKVTDDFEYQLLSLCRKTEGGTSTAALRRFLTRFVPRDDAWQFVPELRVNVRKVEKGKEGAVIRIYRFSGEAAKL